jgi:hypothetical protein
MKEEQEEEMNRTMEERDASIASLQAEHEAEVVVSYCINVHRKAFYEFIFNCRNCRKK